MIRILRAVVPLAERAGRVAGGLEGVGDRLLVEVQPLAAGGDAAYAAARVIAAGEKLGPRRRADRADEEPIEESPRLLPGNRWTAWGGSCSR